MPNKLINIILAEDHMIVRGGIKAILEKYPEFVVSGEASNGLEVISLLEAGVEADLILADINMPEFSGIQLVEWITANRTDLKVIVLSALDNEQYVLKAIRAGASGYLLKNVSPAELVFSIKHVISFGQYICAELSAKFLNRLITLPEIVPTANPLAIDFSHKEIELLQLIAEGYTNQEISDKLFTSVRTIENQRQQLINKTGSRNTVVLIRFAMLHNII